MLPFCTALLSQQLYKISVLELDRCYDILLEILSSVLFRYYIFIGDTSHNARIFHLEIPALMLIRSKFSFREVYHQIYSRKFSFTVTREEP